MDEFRFSQMRGEAHAKKESSMAINERFEIMAELFHASTGLLAPGKSAPPELQTEQYGIDRQTAWGEWSDTKALNMAIKFIQALRHNEAEHDRLYDALINSDTNQLRQERDALRLRIKAVDEEHVQLAEERKKMIDAYQELEKDRNFWKAQHAQEQNIYLAHIEKEQAHSRKEIEKEREAFKEEMRNGFKDLQRVEKERDQYKRLWIIRGKALGQPCLECGYQQEKIVFERSDPS